MFVRKGEALGSIQVGVDPSEPEDEQKPESQSEQPKQESAPESKQEPQQGPEAPKHADTKADWVDYAVSQGTDREEAESLTKADLIEMYGG
jgi:hypothetical protein